MVAAIGFGTSATPTPWQIPFQHHLHPDRRGALNAVFVPQLVRHIKNDADRGDATLTDCVDARGHDPAAAVRRIGAGRTPHRVRRMRRTTTALRDVEVAVAFARFCLPQIFFTAPTRCSAKC